MVAFRGTFLRGIPEYATGAEKPPGSYLPSSCHERPGKLAEATVGTFQVQVPAEEPAARVRAVRLWTCGEER